jgi:GDP-mannose transporter
MGADVSKPKGGKCPMNFTPEEIAEMMKDVEMQEMVKDMHNKNAETKEPQKNVADSKEQKAMVTFAIAGYATCSSLMLVVNKVAVHTLPAPSFVLLAQLVTSAAAVWFAGAIGWIKVDRLEMGKAISFFPVATAFLGAIFTNIKTLQYANVETFIVFRSSTPVLISVADYLFLGRELPSSRSWMSLLGLVCGAMAYVMTDHAYQVHGYFWVCVWYLVFSFDQIYIKHAVDTVKMESNWGRVYYTNLLSCIPLILHGLWFGNDWPALDSFTPASSAALGVSCLLGVAMSYFAFLCRKLVSAASFTVIGNCCKVATVCINLLIWENHANAIGVVSLLFCLFCTYFYQQAPMRREIKRIDTGADQ